MLLLFLANRTFAVANSAIHKRLEESGTSSACAERCAHWEAGSSHGKSRSCHEDFKLESAAVGLQQSHSTGRLLHQVSLHLPRDASDKHCHLQHLDGDDCNDHSNNNDRTPSINLHTPENVVLGCSDGSNCNAGVKCVFSNSFDQCDSICNNNPDCVADAGPYNGVCTLFTKCCPSKVWWSADAQRSYFICLWDWFWKGQWTLHSNFQFKVTYYYFV